LLALRGGDRDTMASFAVPLSEMMMSFYAEILSKTGKRSKNSYYS
jgi:hypothetical protein